MAVESISPSAKTAFSSNKVKTAFENERRYSKCDFNSVFASDLYFSVEYNSSTTSAYFCSNALIFSSAPALFVLYR